MRRHPQEAALLCAALLRSQLRSPQGGAPAPRRAGARRALARPGSASDSASRGAALPPPLQLLLTRWRLPRRRRLPRRSRKSGTRSAGRTATSGAGSTGSTSSGCTGDAAVAWLRHQEQTRRRGRRTRLEGAQRRQLTGDSAVHSLRAGPRGDKGTKQTLPALKLKLSCLVDRCQRKHQGRRDTQRMASSVVSGAGAEGDAQQQQSLSLEALPDDILLCILRELCAHDLAALKATSSRFARHSPQARASLVFRECAYAV